MGGEERGKGRGGRDAGVKGGDEGEKVQGACRRRGASRANASTRALQSLGPTRTSSSGGRVVASSGFESEASPQEESKPAVRGEEGESLPSA